MNRHDRNVRHLVAVPVLGQFVKASEQTRVGDVGRVGDMSLGVFDRTPNIEHRNRVLSDPALEFLYTDVLRSRKGVTGRSELPDRSPYAVNWALDESGSMVPGSNDANDEYKSNELLPADDPFKVNLPPWRAFRFVPFDENKHGGLGEKKSPASQKSEP